MSKEYRLGVSAVIASILLATLIASAATKVDTIKPTPPKPPTVPVSPADTR